MPLKVNTFPATIEPNSSLYLKLVIETANAKIEQMADELRNSEKVKLDPNDGREMIITYKVSPKSGSIETTLDYNPPTSFR